MQYAQVGYYNTTYKKENNSVDRAGDNETIDYLETFNKPCTGRFVNVGNQTIRNLGY